MRVNTYQPPPPPTSSKGSDYSRLLAQKQNAVINITTDEGDKISINTSLASRRQTRLHANNNGLDMLTSKLSVSRQSIQVQGDLNPAELADLGRLLDDLSSIADDFFKGNMKQAVSGALNLGNMGSLSRVEASFTNTKTTASRLAYHPTPNQAAGFSNLLTKHKTEVGQDKLGASLSDILRAQWQQLASYLDERTAAVKHNHNSRQPLTRPAAHRTSRSRHDRPDHGQTMMARAKEMMNRLPRLTPLVPAVGDLAINKAAAKYDSGLIPPALISGIRHNFHDAFRSWML